jgi:hypothetical protein
MSTAADWVKGYARQADADFKTFQDLQGNKAVPQCHKLLFLQMACEKLCKAHLILGGSNRDLLQTSHGYIAGPLPTIIKQEIVIRAEDVRRLRAVLTAARHLAHEIELLNPAVDRNGQRPDNCEYPWEDHGGQLHSPLDWTFHPPRLLLEPSGSTILKLIRLAINRLL